MSTPTRKRSLSGPSGSMKKKKYNWKFQADWMKDFQNKDLFLVGVDMAEMIFDY
jgi:hypothetical protein